MKIKTIEISGFRQITHATFNLENGITFLAGANNSGKTSLVELLNCIFNFGNEKFSGEDFSVVNTQKWINEVLPLILAFFQEETQKESIISNICNLIFPDTDEQNEIIIEPIKLKIQIDYDAANDDIRNFADYIMDLDPSSSSFYFVYEYNVDNSLFRKNLINHYDKLEHRAKKILSDSENNNDANIKKIILKVYFDSLSETIRFTDSKFENGGKVDRRNFIKLFNFQKIMAGRTLDDTSTDRSKILSKNIVDIASEDEKWAKTIESLPDTILKAIESEKIDQIVKDTSINSLKETMSSISMTNGGQANEIIIDMDITEESIKSLLKNITSAKYMLDEHYLNESSQGLGYSNLIYMHLQLEKFNKTIDPLLVNLFVIEEPESHMHPQMQYIFSQYLLTYFASRPELQGFITTHSHEVVRGAKLSQLRVLRKVDSFKCSLYDLRNFHNNLEGTPQLLDFYNYFYSISFPDIIFADKVILYEGDTERMLINSLLKADKTPFPKLKSQYLSFVQVGGAYAVNYEPILKYLDIKSLIITDIDYGKECNTKKEIEASKSTNDSINKLLNMRAKTENTKTIKDIYSCRENKEPYALIRDNICLTFQGEKDGYTRTLEEAMLCKLYGIKSFDTQTKIWWKDKRKSDNLKYSIPNDASIGVRKIINSTSKNKTDFMYSVVLNNKLTSMLPYYIEEGLKWLEK
ncbi:AAA family ATPase [Enterococcus saccharolyticus]|uniref:Uncharacterized protein n=1 Tax=Enterococcus saccharolyticus subsp. saccharolyticus ATCC 43076 TaxID=1139996 RepID=S0J5C6_9ENTE|nr:AAA family ATPase [Enterococcus saccharolyticus]EOT28089.1 hypothetical protein OMQ_02004 [Enterococcus saccharolyticus subsp. saccharolyticus ATCC 43076]EOT77467.1 hypothetical protein I572_02380 [Enterococcus saccharolyticus subsp. saccharolyticus ATCC 43076]OJG90760.1 hypothetical protein RV16_GL001008 [Enterococcus saccharolyticus]